MLLIYTADEVLSFGLTLVGFDEHRQRRQQRKSNVEDFKGHFGTQPVVVAQIWEDLQTTEIAAARINTAAPKEMVSLKTFLRSMHFLKRYPAETERKGSSGRRKKTVRKWCWYFLERVQALKKQKVRYA